VRVRRMLVATFSASPDQIKRAKDAALAIA